MDNNYQNPNLSLNLNHPNLRDLIEGFMKFFQNYNDKNNIIDKMVQEISKIQDTKHIGYLEELTNEQEEKERTKRMNIAPSFTSNKTVQQNEYSSKDEKTFGGRE